MSDPVMCIVLAAGKGTRMRSDLPKVLHRVGGKPMVQRVVDTALQAGASQIVAVVGYRAEDVRAQLGNHVVYVMQTEQRGTGHAVIQALPLIRAFPGEVLVLHGDMPLISLPTLQSVLGIRRAEKAQAVIGTLVAENPPDFGRVLRDAKGEVRRIVEVGDATSKQLAIKEVNVGIYCFQAAALASALEKLTDDNAHHEFYLTDTVGWVVKAGGKVKTFQVRVEEALGVSDRRQLEFAEKLGHIQHAESLFEWIDEMMRDRRGKKR